MDVWKQIMPGVYGAIPDPDQTRLRALQAGGAETRTEYIAFLRKLATGPGPHTMTQAGAKFLLELENVTP